MDDDLTVFEMLGPRPLHLLNLHLFMVISISVTTIFNPAPGPASGLADEFFKYSDIICPNESEVRSADFI